MTISSVKDLELNVLLEEQVRHCVNVRLDVRFRMSPQFVDYYTIESQLHSVIYVSLGEYPVGMIYLILCSMRGLVMVS